MVTNSSASVIIKLRIYRNYLLQSESNFPRDSIKFVYIFLCKIDFFVVI